MENEMIERVAQAIWQGLQSKPPMLSAESLIAAAQYAVAAMREPTEAMIKAGHIGDPLGCDIEESDAPMIYRRIWQFMNDAALTPPTNS